MLGLIHKRVLGIAPQPFEAVLPYSEHVMGYATRLRSRRHSKQLFEPRLTSDMQKNSLLGLVRVYNLLPGSTVDTGNVHVFQQELTITVKDLLQHGHPAWHMRFPPDMVTSEHDELCASVLDPLLPLCLLSPSPVRSFLLWLPWGFCVVVLLCCWCCSPSLSLSPLMLLLFPLAFAGCLF